MMLKVWWIGEGDQLYFNMIVDDCKDILKHFDKVLVVFVPSYVNTVTHLLTKTMYFMSNFQ